MLTLNQQLGFDGLLAKADTDDKAWACVAGFVHRVVESHVSHELKGKLVPIAERYRKR